MQVAPDHILNKSPPSVRLRGAWWLPRWLQPPNLQVPVLYRAAVRAPSAGSDVSRNYRNRNRGSPRTGRRARVRAWRHPLLIHIQALCRVQSPRTRAWRPRPRSPSVAWTARSHQPGRHSMSARSVPVRTIPTTRTTSELASRWGTMGRLARSDRLLLEPEPGRWGAWGWAREGDTDALSSSRRGDHPPRRATARGRLK